MLPRSHGVLYGSLAFYSAFLSEIAEDHQPFASLFFIYIYI